MTMERLTIVDFIARLPLDPIFISGSRRNFVSHTCSRHAANISARTNTQLIRRSPIPENQSPRKMSRQGDEALAFRGLAKIINGGVARMREQIPLLVFSYAFILLARSNHVANR